MKSLLTFLSVLFLFTYSEKEERIANNSDLNDRDIFEYLEETKEALQESVEDLTEAQMQYQPEDGGWSVAQVMEHIVIVERSIYTMLKEKFDGDEDLDKKAMVKMTDDEVVVFITDRSEKIKTSPQFEPAAEFENADDAWETFDDQREDIVDFLKDTEVDMRNFVSEFPFGMLDSYQTVLFMAGHTSRHTAQIEEIKAEPGFPVD